MKNLWPDLGSLGNGLTPKDVLILQSDNLSDMTNGIIQGVIKSSQVTKESGESFIQKIENDSFIHSFNINAPKIKYSFSLLAIVHQTIKIFPCEVSSDIAGVDEKANSKEELENILSKTFNHKDVVLAIKSLILQSKSEDKSKTQHRNNSEIDDDLPF